MTVTGRPPKLTPDLQARIVQRIVTGNYPEVAAGAEGVPRATFYEWMQRGLGNHPERKRTASLAAFAEAVMQAIDSAEALVVARLFEFEQGLRRSKRTAGRLVKSRITWSQAQAMQWRLARSRPERWGQRPVADGDALLEPPEAEMDPADMRPQINVILHRPHDEEAEADAEELRERYAETNRAPRLGEGTAHPCPEELAADSASSSGRGAPVRGGR